ncbi:MAG: acyltransferase family protein [Clostridium sp.]|nr:acyltransferase family protein [Clostridium sp.]MBQ9000175.1 acyltransferase family protein [Clostridium sp.]
MKNKNSELTILKAIGIISVVSCHIGVNIFNLLGIPLSANQELFPEYSYHMPLFIFLSGYFYKKSYDYDILNLIKKRATSLLNYLKCNIFYFILAFLFIYTGILNRQIKFNLHSLLIEPFLGGFQFYFNGPGWFVPFLFLLQITYTILRRLFIYKDDILKKHNKTCFKDEVKLISIFGILGTLSTILSVFYPVKNDNVTLIHSLLRVFFGLQFFQLGFIYNNFIEKKVNFSIKSFSLIIIIKILLIMSFGNYSFSLRTLKFDNSIVLPTVYSIAGIIYCLHISNFIFNKFNNEIIRVFELIGENTWSIMMHHLLIKWCLIKIYKFNFIPQYVVNIGNYLISPILCILLPLGFSIMHKSISSKVKDKNKPKDKEEKVYT